MGFVRKRFTRRAVHRNGHALQQGVEPLEARLMLASVHITHDETWADTSQPYMLTGSLYVDAGAVLTISPGVTVRGDTSARTLYISGAVTGAEAILGTNLRVQVNNGGELNLSGTTLNNEWVSYADGSAGILSDNRFSSAALYVQSDLVSIDGNTFPLSAPIETRPDMVSELADNAFTGSNAAIAIQGHGSGDSTWGIMGTVSRYVLDSSTYIDSGGSVTIAPGVSVTGDVNARTLYVSGTLNGSYMTLGANLRLQVNSGGWANIIASSLANSSVNCQSGSTMFLEYSQVSALLTIAAAASLRAEDNNFAAVTVSATGSSTATIDLSGNYWGATTAAEIAAKITDHSDDSRLPAVQFSQWLGADPLPTRPAITLLSGHITNSLSLSDPSRLYFILSDVVIGSSGVLSLDGIEVRGLGTIRAMSGGRLDLADVTFAPAAAGDPRSVTVVYEAGSIGSASGSSGTWSAQVASAAIAFTGNVLRTILPGGALPLVVGNTFTDPQPISITLTPEAVPQVLDYGPLYANNTFAATKVLTVRLNQSGVLGGDTYIGLSDALVVYVVQLSGGSITMASSTITIEAGVVIKMGDGHRFTLDNSVSNIVAQGTPDRPSIITSIHDDTIGGDSDGDSGANPPHAGSWDGLQFNNSKATGVLSNVEIRYAGTAISMQAEGSTVTLRNAKLLNGRFGIYSYIPSVKVTAENTVIANNQYAGVFLRADSRGHVLRNCTIVGNGFGGTGWYGAGVHIGGSTTTIENSIIAFNATGLQHEGDPPQLVVRHTLFYNPDGEEVAWEYGDPGKPDLSSSGNMVADPRFVDAVNRNFSLNDHSPAIDAGFGTDAPAADLAGQARFDDPGVANVGAGTLSYVDLGAYERQASSPAQDLSVVKVDDPSPQSLSSAQPLTVAWMVRNTGTVDLSGGWADSVYLSQDPYPSADDQLLGTMAYSQSLAVGATYQGGWSGAVPSAAAGPMYVYVRINASRALVESDWNNNIKATAGQVDIAVPSLELGASAPLTIQAGEWQYFSFTATDAAPWRVVLETLGSASGLEVSLRRGAAPTPQLYDAAGRHDGNSRLVAAPAHPAPGRYYLAVHRTAGSAATLSLRLEASPVRITGFTPNHAAATGVSTLQVSGEGFTAGMTAALVSGTGQAMDLPVTVHSAVAASIVCDPQALGLAAGAYHLRLQAPGQPAITSASSLQIDAAAKTGFMASVTMQGIARPGRFVSIQVEYANTGNADIPSPVLRLEASMADLQWIIPERNSAIQGRNYELLAAGGGADPGILRAGESRSLTIRAQLPYHEGTLAVKLISSGTPDDAHRAQPIDWNAVEAMIRPAAADDAAWQRVFSAIKTKIGNTWGDYYESLRDAAPSLSAEGQTIFSSLVLFGRVMDRALGVASGVVVGQLVDDGGNAVPNVRLWLINQATGDRRPLRSDARGAFTAHSLASGTYDVEVEGFYLLPAEQTFTISAESVAAPVLSVRAAAQVAGSVRAADGSPVVDAHVVVQGVGGAARDLWTDAAGQFSVSDLEPGQFQIRAEKDGYMASLPLLMQVGAGERQPNLLLTLGTGARIQGTVIDAATGQVVSSALLEAHGPDGASAGAISDAQGHFVLSGLAVGDWSVRASADRYLPGTADVSIGAAADTVDAPVSLQSAAEISGIVRDSDGAAMEAALVYVAVENGTLWSATTAADGSFQFPSLPGGRYQLRIEAGGEWAPMTEDVTVAAGQALALGDLQLGAASIVSGTVETTDGNPITSGTKLAIISDAHTFSAMVDAAADGTFTFTGLPIGAYTVQAVNPDYQNATLAVAVGVSGSTQIVAIPMAPRQATTPIAAALASVSAAAADESLWSRTGYSGPVEMESQLANPPYPRSPECLNALLGDRTLSEWHGELSERWFRLDAGAGERKLLYAKLRRLEREYNSLQREIDRARDEALWDMGVFFTGGALHGMGAELAQDILEAADSVQNAATGDSIPALYGAVALLAGLFVAPEAAAFAGLAALVNTLLWRADQARAADLGQTRLMAEYQSARQRFETLANSFGVIQNYLEDLNYYLGYADKSCCELVRMGLSLYDPLAQVERELGIYKDPCLPEPQGPSNRQEDDGQMGVSSSQTPEDLFGPSGYDAPSTPAASKRRYLIPGGSLAYRVEFWNKPDATVPTQDAVIENTLDSDFDFSSLRLTRIGFLKWDRSLPGGQSINTRIDMRPDVNLAVDVTATFNSDTGKIRWWFHAVDPDTGLPPDDPMAGFLPPYNEQTGYEIGWVEYSVSPKAGLPSGRQLANQAFVEFDDPYQLDPGDTLANHPAPKTGPWINTVDAASPASSVAALPAVSGLRLPVTWSGADEKGGSGIASYDVYVSDNKGPYRPWLTRTTARTATFTGKPGHTYRFYSIATDHVGHVERAPAAPDSSTTISAAPVASLAASSIRKASKKPFIFKVIYKCNDLVNAATLGKGDVIVTGPRKYKQTATFISRSPAKGNAKSIAAIYSIPAPAGAWDAVDNGVYAVTLAGKQVRDMKKRWSLPTKLGQFSVAIGHRAASAKEFSAAPSAITAAPQTTDPANLNVMTPTAPAQRGRFCSNKVWSDAEVADNVIGRAWPHSVKVHDLVL